MSIQPFLQSKYFRGAAIATGLLVLILGSFALGMRVGFHKALFSAKWGENYERNFLGDGDRGGRGLSPLKEMKMMGKGMRNAHGTAGEVISVAGETIILKDRNDQENTIRVNESTIINRGKDTIEVNTLAPGDRVVVIGKPQEDGVIAAHLIRVLIRPAANQ